MRKQKTVQPRKQIEYYKALLSLHSEFAYAYYADKGVDWSEVQYTLEVLLNVTDTRPRYSLIALYRKSQAENYAEFQSMILDEFELTENDEDLCFIEALALEIHERYLKLKWLGEKDDVRRTH